MYLRNGSLYNTVCVVYMFVCGGGDRSGSVGSLGSIRSSSSLQSSGNTHVLTTPAPSPHPAPTPGVNTHGLNAPGLHAQAEGVKVKDSSRVLFLCMRLHITLLLDLYKATSMLFLGNNKAFSGNKHNSSYQVNHSSISCSALPLERSESVFFFFQQ